ncbi:hypothetical protein VTK56DRAFT_5795 [Thermocarpiscus australiensis]
MADVPDLSRPSFTAFWKQSVEALGAKRIRFVQGKSAEGGDTLGGVEQADAQNNEPAKATPRDKAQLRRSQVRKAQAQHRGRKANYVKQLETDVSRIRQMIATAERETQVLLAENDANESRDTPLGCQSDGLTPCPRSMRCLR